MSQSNAERWLAKAGISPRSPSDGPSVRPRSAAASSLTDDRSPRSQGQPQVSQQSKFSDENERSGATVPLGRPPMPAARPAASNRYSESTSMPSRSEGGSPERFFSRGNEKLYEAYSQLHTMAQDFDKPFDSPAILVVGHQTDGKSALVEALMGFQFNHVGGGTKTRRPIAINMKYNAHCHDPRCYLMKEDSYEDEMSLEDLQDYIEAENRRLDAENGFWAKEIVIKIEYKYCPNLTIIDTPGLINAVPGRKNTNIQAAARAVEALVRSKMERRDFIILCLEDTSDWNNATTRRLVLQVDPELRRTVLVSTKFDTRIPQFSRAADVELFIKPSKVTLEANPLGGGPFFTSVPSGRVGNSRESLFRSNDQYREAVLGQELADISEVEKRLDRRLEGPERSRVGVSQLRQFLERLLQRRYLENVPAIVPVLEREHRLASQKLGETLSELDGLDGERLRDRGRAFYSHFVQKIPLLLRGTMAAPPERFGETLADEHIRGGTFVGEDGRPLPAREPVPNAEMRLFGGAQYHRALEEFRMVVGGVRCPPVAREEIINACGMDEVHDGVNFTRTACVIAVAKAREAFEPFLHQLGFRLAHIIRRLLPISMYLLQKEGKFINGHDLFIKRIGATYHAFIEKTARDCQGKCIEDLMSTTEFVTWSLHSNNKAGLRSVLGGGRGRGSQQQQHLAAQPAASSSSSGSGAGGAIVPAPAAGALAVSSPQDRLMDLVENGLWSRKLADVTQDVVGLLVQQLFEGIRDNLITSAELKFNCFFLMPCIHAFPAKLREELEGAMDDDLDSVFDVGAVRSALDTRKSKLESELNQMERIQEKFNSIHSQLCRMASTSAPEAGATQSQSQGGGGGQGGAKTHHAAPQQRERVPLGHVQQRV